MNLSAIIQKIIPENIKSIPLVQICTNIFVEMLDRNSLVSQRISSIYDIDKKEWYQEDSEGNVSKIEDSGFLEESKKNLKSGLSQLYLAVLHDTILKIQQSSIIREATELRGYKDSAICKDISSIITREYLGGFRFFQQNSGTGKALKYIYQLSKYLESGNITTDLEIEDCGPFNVAYQGSLHKSYFAEFNQPLSHPCGWTYLYETILSQELVDYYGVEITRKLPRIVLTYHYGSKCRYVIFASKTIDQFYTNLYNDNNDLRRQRFTSAEVRKLKQMGITRLTSDTYYSFREFDDQDIGIILVNVDFQKFSNDVIYFKNTCLSIKNLTYTTVSNLGTSKGYKFSNLWSLDIGSDSEITTDFKFTYRDELTFEDETEVSSNGYYFKDNILKAFNLQSSLEYPFVPGVDETMWNIDNYSTNNKNAFLLNIDVKCNNMIYLKISDNYGHEHIQNIDAEKSLKIPTHGWYGDTLNIEAKKGDLNYKLSANILNKPNASFKIISLKCFDDSIFIELSKALEYNVKLTQGSNTEVYNINSKDIELHNLENTNEFSLEIVHNDEVIKIECSNLNTSLVSISFPKYDGNVESYTVKESKSMINIPTSGKTLKSLQNTLVHKGYEKVKTDSEDCIIANSTKYVDDDFNIDQIIDGNYLTFDEATITRFITCYENITNYDKNRGHITYSLVFRK